MDDSFEGEIDFNQTLDVRDQRRSFLITYTQADLEKVPNCMRFAEIVLQGFNEGPSNREVSQWACCMEDHADGGKHYHLAILFSGARRWIGIKNSIMQTHGVNLHFSSQHVGYVAAYRYLLKSNAIEDVLHSPGHTDMQTIKRPKTKDAMKGNSSKGKKRKSSVDKNQIEPPLKRARLNNSEVSLFIVKNSIKSKTELMRIANERLKCGDSDLHTFIVNRTPKSLCDLITTTWELENAQSVIDKKTRSRISVVQEFASQECQPECGGKWMRLARQVLQLNNINAYVFGNALRQCLIKGRRKHTNVLLFGPRNCGKSFLLDPMEKMFTCFLNPAKGKYAWVNLDECDVAILQDFRWNSETISWSDLLLLLEGQTVHLPRPRNLFATDLELPRSNTIPFFATSKSIIEYIGPFDTRDEQETDMMSVRWNTFQFTHKFAKQDIVEVDSCPNCFSKLVLLGADDEV